jgi:hypothetical protein
LYGKYAFSFTLREDRGIRVFKNRLLQKILGSKREEAKEELIQSLK